MGFGQFVDHCSRVILAGARYIPAGAPSLLPAEHPMMISLSELRGYTVAEWRVGEPL